MSLPRSATLALMTFAVAGCPQERACTADARSSISLTVTDESGGTVEGVTATYTVDGGEEEDCESWGGDSFACAFERAGTFELRVAALGYESHSETIEVASDECHVITEVVEVALTPLACTDSIEASVLVTVTDGQLADVTSGDVVWNMADEDDLPEACDHLGGNQWHCAYEVAGELRIGITNAGPYEVFDEVVTVTADECHVLTEELDAVLQYLPD